MSERYLDLVGHLRNAVLASPGAVDPALRQAVEARAAALGGRPGPKGDVPAAVASYVDKVAKHAYQITDQDVEALRRSGYSEDAVFEITAAAAMGASLARLERGLSLLKGGT